MAADKDVRGRPSTPEAQGESSGARKLLENLFDLTARRLFRERMISTGSKIAFWTFSLSIGLGLASFFFETVPLWVAGSVLLAGVLSLTGLFLMNGVPNRTEVARFLDRELAGKDRYLTAETCLRRGRHNSVEEALILHVAGEAEQEEPTARLAPLEPPWEAWGTLAFLVAFLVFALLWAAQLVAFQTPGHSRNEAEIKQLIAEVKQVQKQLEKPEAGKPANEMAQKLSKLLEDLSNGKRPDPETVNQAILKLPEIARAIQRSEQATPEMKRVAQFLSKSGLADKMKQALEEGPSSSLGRQLANLVGDTGGKPPGKESQRNGEAKGRDGGGQPGGAPQAGGQGREQAGGRPSGSQGGGPGNSPGANVTLGSGAGSSQSSPGSQGSDPSGSSQSASSAPGQGATGARAQASGAESGKSSKADGSSSGSSGQPGSRSGAGIADPGQTGGGRPGQAAQGGSSMAGKAAQSGTGTPGPGASGAGGKTGSGRGGTGAGSGGTRGRNTPSGPAPMTADEKALLDKLQKVASGGKGKSPAEVLRDMGKLAGEHSGGRRGTGTRSFRDKVKNLVASVKKGTAGASRGPSGNENSGKSQRGLRGNAASNPIQTAPPVEGQVVQLDRGQVREGKQAGTGSIAAGLPAPGAPLLPAQIDEPSRKAELEQHYKEETARYLSRERVPSEYRELIRDYFSGE